MTPAGAVNQIRIAKPTKATITTVITTSKAMLAQAMARMPPRLRIVITATNSTVQTE